MDLHTGRGTFFVRDSGSGFPLVLLHGWPESSLCWEDVVAQLGPGLRCIRPDLRGLGKSERTRNWKLYRKQELARDILEILSTLELGDADFALAGHDWGGTVAQELCFLVPERVRRLVLSNIPIINNWTGYEHARRAMFESRMDMSWYQTFQQVPGLAEGLITGREDVWLKTFLVTSKTSRPIPEDHVQAYIEDYSRPHTPETAANYYRTLPFDTKRWRKFAGMRNPVRTLIVYGEKDNTIIPEYFHGFEECFQDVRMVRVDSGHFVPEEQPGELAMQTGAFLEDLRAPTSA